MKSLYNKEVSEARKELKRYGFNRKSAIGELIAIFVVVAVVAAITWLVVRSFGFERVAWSQAFTATLSLTVAIIAYRQWRAARHEISIDKYYDRLEVANKRLEQITSKKPSPDDMHVFAELDKLEYVIAKYELGYISPILALRALRNFAGLCSDLPAFRAQAEHWVHQASYRNLTRSIVAAVCSQCAPPSASAAPVNGSNVDAPSQPKHYMT